MMARERISTEVAAARKASQQLQRQQQQLSPQQLQPGGMASQCSLPQPEAPRPVPPGEIWDVRRIQDLGAVLKLSRAGLVAPNVVVEFCDTWSIACHQDAQKNAGRRGERLRFTDLARLHSTALFARVNVLHVPSAESQLGVRCVPSYMFFFRGKKSAELCGFSERALRETVSQNLNPSAEACIRQEARAIASAAAAGRRKQRHQESAELCGSSERALPETVAQNPNPSAETCIRQVPTLGPTEEVLASDKEARGIASSTAAGRRRQRHQEVWQHWEELRTSPVHSPLPKGPADPLEAREVAAEEAEQRPTEEEEEKGLEKGLASAEEARAVDAAEAAGAAAGKEAIASAQQQVEVMRNAARKAVAAAKGVAQKQLEAMYEKLRVERQAKQEALELVEKSAAEKKQLEEEFRQLLEKVEAAKLAASKAEVRQKEESIAAVRDVDHRGHVVFDEYAGRATIVSKIKFKSRAFGPDRKDAPTAELADPAAAGAALSDLLPLFDVYDVPAEVIYCLKLSTRDPSEPPEPGLEEWQRRMAQNRATCLMDLLVQLGAPEERLSAVGQVGAKEFRVVIFKLVKKAANVF